jgi:hypothetical protein
LLAYMALLSLVVGGLAYGRSQALSIYGSKEAQNEWDTWREDAKQMASEAGPVRRRVPKSAEPPALVLMRDYFVICLGLAVVLSSILFATFMFFVRGAMGTNALPRRVHER